MIKGVSMHSSDVNKLRQYMERIENLEAEKAEVQDNISDTYKQAKNDGFDPKVMKKVLRLKKMKTVKVIRMLFKI